MKYVIHFCLTEPVKGHMDAQPYFVNLTREEAEERWEEGWSTWADIIESAVWRDTDGNPVQTKPVGAPEIIHH